MSYLIFRDFQGFFNHYSTHHGLTQVLKSLSTSYIPVAWKGMWQKWHQTRPGSVLLTLSVILEKPIQRLGSQSLKVRIGCGVEYALVLRLDNSTLAPRVHNKIIIPTYSPCQGTCETTFCTPVSSCVMGTIHS